MTETTAGAAVFDGVAVPSPRYAAQGATRPRYRPTIGLLALGLTVAMVVLGVWDWAVKDASAYRCPPDCGRPPGAVAVRNLPRFTAPDGEFSVAYPAPGPLYQVTTANDGVTARLVAGDGGVLRLLAEPARGRVARQVVTQFINKNYRNSEIAYELPNAAVGYHVGYGVVANFMPPGVSTRYELRLIIMAAVKNDLALIGVAEGPFRRFTSTFGPGPPSGANLELAMDMGKYVESFRWKGDRPG